jgi:lipopolysaccharide transport system permease protein
MRGSLAVGRGRYPAPVISEQAAAVTSAAFDPRARVRRIQPSRGLVLLDLAELWRYRELLWFLVWRDVKARYRQTFLGAFWAIFRPLLSMVLFAAIFGGLAGITSGSSTPYPLFLYSGLVGWTYFSSAFTGSSSSLLNNGPLIGKAYFPRLFAPLASVIAPLVDLLLSLVVLFGIFAWYQTLPSWHIVFLPLFVLLTMLAGLGIGLWLSAISVRYRDVPFALPFVIQIWMYVTPVIYPVTLVPERFRWLLALNPMTAGIDGTRWSLIAQNAPSVGVLASGIAVVAVLLGGGLLYFHRAQRTLVDLI